MEFTKRYSMGPDERASAWLIKWKISPAANISIL